MTRRRSFVCFFFSVSVGCAALVLMLSLISVKPASAGKPPRPVPPGVLYYTAHLDGMPTVDIYSMAADGSNKTLVFADMGVETDASQHLHGGARWFLVFLPFEGETYPDGTTREELFAISTAGGEFQLTDDPTHQPNVGGWRTRYPRWSLGDGRASWLGRRWDLGSGTVSELGIFCVNLEKDISLGPTPAVPARVPIASYPTNLDNLGYPKPRAHGFDGSPDGTSFVFGSDEGLYVADAHTGSTAQITNTGSACEPRWSPDGSSIAFTANASIWTVSPAGLNLNVTNVVERTTGVNWFFKPVWSTDGGYLSCEEFIWKNQIQDILRVKPDGSGLTNLTSDTKAWITLIGWTSAE